jgi:DNA replication licensing factor MCM2
MKDMEKDYVPIKELDEYEEQGLDEEEYSEMAVEERKKVDSELDNRDKKKSGKSGRIPRAMEEVEEYSEDENLQKRLHRQRMKFTAGAEDETEYKDTSEFLSRTDVKGKLSDWLKEPHVNRYIQISFNKFIKNFKDENGNNVYESRIIEMCTSNKQTLEVNFNHINQSNQHLAIWIAQLPSQTLPILNDVAYSLCCEIFPQYGNIHTEIFVRIMDLPLLENLRELRHYHINTLIKVRGVVTKRTNVFSQLKKVMYYCSKCGEKIGPFHFNGIDEIKIGSCQSCQSTGPFPVNNEETVYKNYQKITMQESPGTIPPGRIPRQKEVILINDLVDTVKPGDEVELTGIFQSRFDYNMNVRYSFPVFHTSIEAVHLKRLNEIELGVLTDEDKMNIRQLSKDPNIAQKIFNSIAPSIYGHQFIKKSLALAMFGGCPKDVSNKHKIRGDINILVLGDPGTAKSQLLSYVNKVFHRSVYTTGKGASAVGLTAGVHKDPVTKEWTLEGGALVLADKGVCLIDEFDKMNDQDRTSIHEAMEQQSISISKAGIVTTLQARCSVIAAANPIKGRYDNQLSFSDNVDLTDPILSRFDILSVVKDEIDFKIDEALATFVINSHISSHSEFRKDHNLKNAKLEDPQTEKIETIPQDLLKKYIMYSRKYVFPKLNDVNKNKVTQFYAELRKESDIQGGISIAVRHLESIIRISEAHAKIHLRDYIRNDDIDVAIKIMLESFLQSQKYSVARNLRKKFAHYLTANEDHNQLLSNILNRMLREQTQYLKYYKRFDESTRTISIKQDAFEREAQDLGIYNIQEFYSSPLFRLRNKINDKAILCDL